MRKFVRGVAVAMWWASIVLPLGPTKDGGTTFGFQAFLGAGILIIMAFPFSLLLVLPVASWISNLVPFRETFRLIEERDLTLEVPFARDAFLVNLVCFTFFLRDYVTAANPFYRYPAVYTWLASFFLLWLSTCFHSEQLKPTIDSSN